MTIAAEAPQLALLNLRKPREHLQEPTRRRFSMRWKCSRYISRSTVISLYQTTAASVLCFVSI